MTVISDRAATHRKFCGRPVQRYPGSLLVWCRALAVNLLLVAQAAELDPTQGPASGIVPSHQHPADGSQQETSQCAANLFAAQPKQSTQAEVWCPLSPRSLISFSRGYTIIMNAGTQRSSQIAAEQPARHPSGTRLLRSNWKAWTNLSTGMLQRLVFVQLRCTFCSSSSVALSIGCSRAGAGAWCIFSWGIEPTPSLCWQPSPLPFRLLPGELSVETVRLQDLLACWLACALLERCQA